MESERRPMKDDRLRVTMEDDYARAIGRAVFVFARLEWGAVWCCEKFEQNYINKLADKTAGTIANDLIRLASARRDMWDSFKSPSVEFKKLVEDRNNLLHGKPGSTPENDQRLFNAGIPWTVAMIDDAADRFTACQILLNDLLHTKLMAE
jgi:hypothetical protein